MKIVISIIAIMAATLSATAQQQISYGYTEIKRTQFDSCRKTEYLTENLQVKKQGGKLTVPVSGKPARVFKDNNSDDTFYEFEYLGDIQGTKLSLIKRTDHNSEECYLINGSTGGIDTLIGFPVFAQNVQRFACINNPATDKKQQIQVCEIKNGSVKTIVFLKGKADTFFEAISCIGQHSILTRDNKGKYWNLNFKIGDE